MTEGDQASLITKQIMNRFNRKYDLVFVNMERNGDGHIYRFIDFENNERKYTADEIFEKVSLG